MLCEIFSMFEIVMFLCHEVRKIFREVIPLIHSKMFDVKYFKQHSNT